MSEQKEKLPMKEHVNSAKVRGTDSAQVLQVIQTKTLIGAGTTENPYRKLVQYWGCDGELLAEKDLI